MELYAKMYAIICHTVSEALDALPESVENAPDRHILQTALYEAEELYISQYDNP